MCMYVYTRIRYIFKLFPYIYEDGIYTILVNIQKNIMFTLVRRHKQLFV